MSTTTWWQENGRLVRWTLAAAVILGVAGGLRWGLGVGLIIVGCVTGSFVVLALSSAAMLGMDRTLDAQIRMRERRAGNRQDGEHG